MVDLKRQDALLSEYKGNIFEYLVCIELAKPFKREIHFLKSLPSDMISILEQQESFLRNHYPHLLTQLPVLARECAAQFIEVKSIKTIQKIILVGKKLASTQETSFNEADILIYTSEEQALQVSVKLSKINSFVNTKSAGIRTIFDKYFKELKVEDLQDGFNKFIDIEYESLAIDMHNDADLHYTHLFENWERCGLEVLPGQLKGSAHNLLINYYKKINTALYKQFTQLHKASPVLFKESLYKLMGFSGEEIIQLTAFYQQKNDVFVKTRIEVIELKEIVHSKSQSVEFKMNPTNFEIKLAGHILQVRAKPMNKFTSKAFKINCSIKNIN